MSRTVKQIWQILVYRWIGALKVGVMSKGEECQLQRLGQS